MIATEIAGPPAEPQPGSGVGWLTAVELADRIVANHSELLDREARVLQLACGWADVHDLDTSDPGYQPLVQRACLFGGQGTPTVAEHCVAEFAALQQLGVWAGRQLIADALDLRHRLPVLWRLVNTGAVRAWQARKPCWTPPFSNSTRPRLRPGLSGPAPNATCGPAPATTG